MLAQNEISEADLGILRLCLGGATYDQIEEKVGLDIFQGFLARLGNYVEVGGTCKQHIISTNQAGRRLLKSRS